MQMLLEPDLGRCDLILFPSGHTWILRVYVYIYIYMGVSKNNGIYPQIIHFNRVFHCKLSILGVFPPYFWKHPYILHKKTIL